MCFSDNNCVGDLNGCGQDEQCGGARAVSSIDRALLNKTNFEPSLSMIFVVITRQNCTTERNCLDEQRCTGDLCKGKEGIGSGCNFNTDCESGLCVGARCAIRRALGQECTSSDECPLNVACSGQCGGIGAVSSMSVPHMLSFCVIERSNVFKSNFRPVFSTTTPYATAP